MLDHFSDPQNIEHEQFRERLWDREPCDRGLEIEVHYKWDPTIANKRPSVTIRNNAWRSVKLGINNQTGVNDQGHETFAKLMQGSHTLFCIAKEGPEAQILTAEIYRYLLGFAPVIRHYFNLIAFEMLEVGDLALLKEANGAYARPITVMYAWMEEWTLFHHQPWLKRFQLSDIVPTC